jgi:membrane fusion protein (multidrug efflux system)
MLKHITAWLALIVAIAGISAGLGFYKYGEIQAGIAAAQVAFEPMEAVATARARQGEWSASTRSIGTVVALRQLEVRNEIAGSIAEMGFKSGDIVEAGQLWYSSTRARRKLRWGPPKPTRVSRK